MWLNWLQQNPIPSLLIGLVLGAIISGLSLFLGNLWYRRHVRPRLFWGVTRVRAAHLSGTLGPGSGGGVQQLNVQIPFYASMIAVHNRGKSAAENCSGHLEIEGNREHICWFLPSSRRVITINRDDFEFLEVCGWQEPDNIAVTARRRIAPTEKRWQNSGRNRDLDQQGYDPIKANIIVSAANADSISQPVNIESIGNLPHPQNEPLFRRR
ncbi:MAG: hypothetical protein DDT33_01779 [Firmicutes bacterium]|nr:hypothetical protein [Bacillota bacterium]